MLYLRTFGGLALDGGRSTSGVAGQRARLALLAVLAAAGKSGISRDKLLTLFWPDSDTGRARGALKQALYALRRDLGDDVIVGNGELHLNPDAISTDVGEFEHAIARGDREAAVACYTGPFLDSVFLRNAPEFERWTDRERARLARARQNTLGELASAAETRGDHAGAVVWWRQASDEDPLDTHTAVSLVRSLALTGDTSGALRQAEAHRALVRQEIGDHADAAMEAMVAAVQSGELCSTPSGVSETTTAPPPLASSSQQLDAGSRVAAENGRSSRSPQGAVSVATLKRYTPRWIFVGLAVACVAAALAFRAWVHPNRGASENAVAVLAACSSPAHAGDGFTALPASELAGVIRKSIANGLTELQSLSVRAVDPLTSRGVTAAGLLGTENVGRAVDVARSVRARILVSAKCRIDGGLTVLSADIIDADSDRVVIAIDPVRARTDQPDSAVARLRDRVMTAIALRVDPKLKNWVHASNAPSTFAGYRELRLGIDAFVPIQLADAAAHFRKAAALDTNSATPLVWAAFARAFYFDPAADSILAELNASQRRLGPWDEAMVAFLEAFRRGDLPLSHVAAHRVAATVPSSEWRVIIATMSIYELRAQEALDIVNGLDPQQGWIQGWSWYWTAMDQGHHLLGEYREELRDVRRAQRHWPNNDMLFQLEVKALAALGDTAELTRRMDEMLSAHPRHPRFGDASGQAASEMVGHFGSTTSRPFFDRHIAHIRSAPDTGEFGLTEEDKRLTIIEDLMLSDRVGEARALFDSVLAGHPAMTGNLLFLDGKIAAWQGDRERAHRALTRFETHDYDDPAPVGPEEPTIGQGMLDTDFAEIHALLGERAEAVALLQRAIRAGYAFRHLFHLSPALNRLRGYPPYDALVRPVASAESRQ